MGLMSSPFTRTHDAFAFGAAKGADDGSRFVLSTWDGYYREGGAEADASRPAVFVLIPYQAAGHFPLPVEDSPGNSPVIFDLGELPHGPAVLSDFSPLG